jgi:hypothetical protein
VFVSGEDEQIRTDYTQAAFVARSLHQRQEAVAVREVICKLCPANHFVHACATMKKCILMEKQIADIGDLKCV